jgi:hypothetical protein
MKKKTKEPKQKCMCPAEGKLYPWTEKMYDEVTERPYVNHEPGQCLCQNELKLFMRGKKKLWLCSCCWLPDDKPVVEKQAKPKRRRK